jgi:2,3-bisphosphoglycerate-dependent phosphoglycerate mutase
MYGSLQGRYKKEVAAQYGLALTQHYRRSYEIAPPAVEGSTGYFPVGDPKYAALTEADIPDSWCGSCQTESLKDTQARAWGLWKEEIAPTLRSGKTVLVVAHGNVIRYIQYIQIQSLHIKFRLHGTT